MVESRPFRPILSSAIVLLLCSGVLWAGVFSFEWYRAQKSKELIKGLRQFRVGQTTEVEVRELANRFGGTYSPRKDATQYSPPQLAYYYAQVSSPYHRVGETANTLPGLRFWVINANFCVEDGRLVSFSSSQIVSRSDGFMLSTTVDLEKADNQDRLLDYGPYNVYEAHLTGPAGERFDVRLSPDATADERRKAFDFNYSCLTQLRECRHVCELLPDAWKDIPRDRRLRDEDGREVVSDSECSKRMK